MHLGKSFIKVFKYILIILLLYYIILYYIILYYIILYYILTYIPFQHILPVDDNLTTVSKVYTHMSKRDVDWDNSIIFSAV